MILYVGAYTGADRATGISTFRVNPQTGGLTPLHTTEAEHPSFLALHPQRPLLYAVNETPPGEGAGPGVSAFGVEPDSGRLHPLGRQPAHGTSPCYVSVDPTGRFVLIANYGTGTLAVYPVEGEGALGEATHVLQHEGSGPTPRRQQGPRGHCVRFDTAGRFVLACDLGIDRVVVYRLDPESGRLAPNDPPSAPLPPGAGPRHLAFHPSGRFAYVNGEIDSTVNVFAYDPERGALDLRQSLSTLPAGFDGDNSTAQILAHPDGHSVYVSNRGHDSIARFIVEESGAALTPAGHEPTGGRTPRNFALDPSGGRLYAANQNSGSIVVFSVEAGTGRLTPTGETAATPAPVCLLFSA